MPDTALSNMSDEQLAAFQRRLDTEKVHLEVAQIRQARWLEPLKFIAAALGTALVFGGLWIERERTRSEHQWDLDRQISALRASVVERRHQRELLEIQQTWQHTTTIEARDFERSDAARRERLGRMVEIASAYDRLYGDTMKDFAQFGAEAVVFPAYLNALSERIKNVDMPVAKKQEFRAEIDDLISKMAEAPKPFTTLAVTHTLRERWISLADGPTPDFAAYFGADDAARWIRVQRAATTALNTLAIDKNVLEDRDVVTFCEVGALFQQSLHQAIVNASAPASPKS